MQPEVGQEDWALFRRWQTDSSRLLTTSTLCRTRVVPFKPVFLFDFGRLLMIVRERSGLLSRFLLTRMMTPVKTPILL